MCLRVDAAGEGKDYGKHVSVFHERSKLQWCKTNHVIIQ